ncbi:MAG: hypothetical protein ABIZ80_12780 [Bryobacteraceae bacterium]
MAGLRILPVAALVLWLGSTSVAPAAITCSTADYNGTYSFFSTGNLVVLPPAGAVLLGQFSQAGTFTSDGQGNVTIDSKASYNGLIADGPAITTYTVSPECEVTYSLTLPFPLSVPSIFKGVLSARNKIATVTIADPPGTVVIGRHVKQDIRFCGQSDFRGAYRIDIDGAISGPASRAGRFHRLGRLVADGDGNFTVVSTGNYAGRLVQENFSGTYEVTGRCSINMRYQNGGEEFTLFGTLGGTGDNASVMMTSQGWAVSGVFQAQQ